MIKSFLLVLIFLFPAVSFGQSDLKALLNELDNAIKNRQQYMDQKELRIRQLRLRLKSSGMPLREIYDINNWLCNEYRPYKNDSAIRYAEHNLHIAESLGDKRLMFEAKLQRASLFSISGMYLEADRLLQGINSTELLGALKADYYQSCKDLYGNISTYNTSGSAKYRHLNGLYRDSLLGVLDTSSSRFQSVYAEKLSMGGRFAEARKIFLNQLQSIRPKTHEHAMVTSAIGNVYKNEGNVEMERKYFALSAISDIHNAIKENTSLQALAIALYEMGDLDHAYQYTKYSMEDAIFCNAPLRTIVISKMFPIIDAAHQTKINAQRKQLLRYLALISILSVCLIVAVIYVLKQMKKLKRGRLALGHANDLLQQLNQDLRMVNEQVSSVNNKLLESNRIKEEYIGNFLDLCSSYINKLEDYRKVMNKKASTGKLEELFKMLRSTDLIDNELKALYKNFDNIFLHLYPNFVEEFNKLLLDGEQFTLKAGELLNTELRIFALVRLGIHDSSRIANFLRCSMSTIYNYRTKVRNKAAVPREDFDRFVVEIGTMSTFYSK